MSSRRTSGRRGSGRGGGRGSGRGCGPGMGRDIGWGRGGGRGMRQGIGRRMDTDTLRYPVQSTRFQPDPERPGPERLRLDSPNQETEMLRAQADALKAQFQTVNARISELEGGDVPAPIDVAGMDAHWKTSNNVRNERAAAVVDKEECVNCGICANVCPEEAIVVDEVAVIDPQRCTGCGLCVEECPNRAISLAVLEGAASW
jgi:ferredoxin